jgi:hypothetical protein
MAVRYDIVPGISTRAMEGTIPPEIEKFVNIQITPVGVFITPKTGVVFYAGMDFNNPIDENGNVLTYYGLDAGAMGKVWFLDRFSKETNTSHYSLT